MLDLVQNQSVSSHRCAVKSLNLVIVCLSSELLQQQQQGRLCWHVENVLVKDDRKECGISLFC